MKVLAVVLMLLIGAGVVLAASPMPDLSYLNEVTVQQLAECPDVMKVIYEQPGHEDKPAYDAYAWYKLPDRTRPFIVVFFDPDTGVAVWYFVDFDRDGVADKQAKTFDELGLSNSACEVAQLVP